jgi:DNA-directed RNA polymerase specialized sigma24 family protein
MSTLDQTPALLADIRSNDPTRVKAAIDRLTEDLIAHARATLGRRQDQANCQAASVVQSVLVRELGAGPDSFENEGHLQGRLRTAVDNKIKDRLKGPKGRTDQASQYADGGLPDPAVGGRGVGTQIAEADRAEAVARSLTDGLDANDQEIIRRAILDDQDANEVASHVPLKPAAIRKRLERLRPLLRRRLLEPLRRSLSAQEWAVVNACLIERLEPEAITELLGVTAEQLARTYESVIRDHVSPAIGDTGLLALGRLLGRAKTEPFVAQ